MAARGRRFCGFKCAAGFDLAYSFIYDQDRVVGKVTAFEYSPFLQSGVGYVLMDTPECLDLRGLNALDHNGEKVPITLCTLPFYDAEKNIPRGRPSPDGEL